MVNKIIVLCLLFLSMFTSGCFKTIGKTLNIGEEDVICHGNEASGRCADVFTIYNNKERIMRENAERKGSLPGGIEDKEDKNEQVQNIPFLNAQPSEKKGNESIVIEVVADQERKSEQVIQIYFNPFVTSKGNKVENFHVLTVKEPSKWMLNEGGK